MLFVHLTYSDVLEVLIRFLSGLPAITILSFTGMLAGVPVGRGVPGGRARERGAAVRQRGLLDLC